MLDKTDSSISKKNEYKFHNIKDSNMKYAQIIENLENAVKEIETKGISIKPLNNAIDDLKSHSKNIEAIEKNINAIKEEVIKPIKTELDENKRAGKFSIWGFYVGAFALVVTTISLAYTTFFSSPNLESRGNNIETSLRNSDITVRGNYKVIVSQTNIYDYYGNNHENAYFDKIPEGSVYPEGTRLFIYEEFKGYGRIIYPNKNGENVRGYIKMADLKKD